MPLAAPTNIQLSNIYRRGGISASRLQTTTGVRGDTGTSDYGIVEMGFYGNLSWTNTETSLHYVEVSIASTPANRSEIIALFKLAKGSTSLPNVYFANFLAAETFNSRQLTFTVAIKNLTETASATLAYTASLQTPVTWIGELAYDGEGGINVPSSYTGVAELPWNTYEVGTLRYAGAALNPANGAVHNLEQRTELTAYNLPSSMKIETFTGGIGALLHEQPARVSTINGAPVAISPTRSPGKVRKDFLAPLRSRTSSGRAAYYSRQTRINRFDPFTTVLLLSELVDGGNFTANLSMSLPQTPTRTSYLTRNPGALFIYQTYKTRAAAQEVATLIGGGVVSNQGNQVYNPATGSLQAGTEFAVTVGQRLAVFEDTIARQDSTIAFTYFYDGLATPRLASDAVINTFIDTDIAYTIVADDAAATFSVAIPAGLTGLAFTAPATIAGRIATAGNYTIPITMTNNLGSRIINLAINAQPFTAFSEAVTLTRSEPARILLRASHRAIFELATSGTNLLAPAGFSLENVPVSFGTAEGPDEVYLVGTPLANGVSSAQLTATRVGVVGSSSPLTITLTVRDPLPTTTITGNSEILRNGVTAVVGSTVNVALSAVPSSLNWTSAGLPPGLEGGARSDGFFIISGAPTEAGEYFAAITAQANGHQVSSALNLRFNITPAPPPPPRTGETALERSGWLSGQWELIDVHVRLRERTVDSTLFEAGGRLRVKLGDALNFAIFFVDQNSAVLPLPPTQLRMTIRLADNLDDLIIFKSATPPPSATQENQTYYLMPVTTGSRERDIALDWAEENGKNAPLECVADIEWTYEGKVYSSRTFPVSLELDVTRP